MVVPRFISWALKNEPIMVYGDGQQQRCFGNVLDVVQAIHHLSESPAAIGQVFNIGSNEEISIAGLAERVRDRAGSQSDIQYISYEEAYEAGFEDFRRRVPSLDKIKHTIEWEPTTPLDVTLDQMIAYQREELNNGR
jgi:UDP-glucose 4-epimerase